ncbi:ABC transporter permease [Alkalihalophilus marmarensis]|jgi:peptide/nickel transport system permease protein|uniref:ABC transporter permease n=1 Tax=Alkalihalophilus marmarensis TaxID=521377 RepID=UPI0020408A5C|nr:ABC transporter permease [Alkalihalophilus marmarensis]MCM3489825.1 ABC transporter permease [Alkalihalophilus marmarensis]
MAQVELNNDPVEEVKADKRKPIGLLLKKIVKNPGALIGLILVTATVVCALFAPLIAPYSPSEANLGSRLMEPSFIDETGTSTYFLGGDQLGRDLLSRIIYGAQISLMVGVFGVLLAMTIGVIFGLLAGYVGKWLDDIIMRIADIQLAFPFILFAIIIMAVFGGGLWMIILVLGLTNWVGFARLIRSEVLSIKELDYIQAARAVGNTPFSVVTKHILPNVASSILVLSTMMVAEFILLEAALTFLGLGIDPSIPSWGGMLADSRNYISSAWWTATFPGVAIMLTVLGFNLLGDWLRDELDPNTK